MYFYSYYSNRFQQFVHLPNTMKRNQRSKLNQDNIGKELIEKKNVFNKKTWKNR